MSCLPVSDSQPGITLRKTLVLYTIYCEAHRIMSFHKQLLFFLVLVKVIDVVYTLDCTDEEQEFLVSQCIDPGSTSNIPCNDHGDCKCGVCNCRRGPGYPYEIIYNYTDHFCNCGNPPCALYKGQVCGGKGRCKCGQCQCDQDYYGRACDCWAYNAKNHCYSSNGMVCNGWGKCICGNCECISEHNYKGPTCEECPTCPGRCPIYKECALCAGFKKGQNSSDECAKQCPNVTVAVVDTIDIQRVQDNDYLNLCQFKDVADNCTFFFTYEYLEDIKIAINVQKQKDCTVSAACTTAHTALTTLGVVTGLILQHLLIFSV